jgi:cell division protein FtsI/penicillin-binding protein 2
MGKKLQSKRLLMLTLLLAAAFVGLGYRLVDLQVLQHAELLHEAESNTHYTYRLEARRGNILDSRGNLLATSVFVKTVFADPKLIGNHAAEVARAIAPLLQVNESELVQKLTPKIHAGEKGEALTNRYVVLKRKVPSETWDRIRQTMDKLTFAVNEKDLSKKQREFYKELRQKAIATEPLDDQLRVYPNGILAAHVLGFTGMTERTNSNGLRTQEVVGKDGIECTLDAKLKGVGGWRVTERDGQHREVVALREEDVEPHDGMNVALTIDSVIQHYAEVAVAGAMQKYSPISASAMVIRPQTGELLALAVMPNYDPNNPGAMTDPSAERDRVVVDVAEPGSTFKSVVVASALNDGTVKLTDQFDCGHGRFEFAGRVLHDHESYGVLTTEYVVAKSSNIGAAQIGIKMGEQRLYEHLKEFGFGQRTGIELPGESKGILPNVKKWYPVSIAQIPMGQGVAVTPLQMAMALCAIANKGVLMRPMIVSEVREQDGTVVTKYAPERVRRVISEEADREIIQALKTVVTDGTAKNAAMTNYTVAGKTGTAQKNDGHKYYQDKYYASFIGFFPADNPEICIYVSLDEPKGSLHQGGQAAAPVFKEIAEKTANYLNIHPDKNVDTGLPDTLPSVRVEPPLRTAAARTQ